MALSGTSGAAFLAPAGAPVPRATPEAWTVGEEAAAPLQSQLASTGAAAAGGEAGSGAAPAVLLAAVAGLGLAASGKAGRRQRRELASARRFFGQQSAPAAPVPQGPLAIPGLPVPAYRGLGDPLLGAMDAGFDPLDLATKPSPWGQGEDSYYNYREAEVKHGRLAMLATVGWLSSEELQDALARKLGLVSELAKGDLAPSLVNGGLGNLPAWFLPAVFMLSAWIEYVPQSQSNRTELLKYKPQKGRAPGDLGFDPLSLKGTLTGMGYSFEQLHNAETKHGRAAMIAIVAFVAQEFIARVPVISEDEISVDRVVETVDKGIDALDKASGLAIPDIPLPFPTLG